MVYYLYVVFRLTLGTLYPAYQSYKAVKTKNVREYVKWMMYWITFAAFTAAESVADIFFSFWFPFYYIIKVVFILWLLSPVSRGSLGSSIVYRKFIHPALKKRETEIDRRLDKISERLYSSFLVWARKALEHGSTWIMQTAIRGVPAIPEIMNEIVSAIVVPEGHLEDPGCPPMDALSYEGAEYSDTSDNNEPMVVEPPSSEPNNDVLDSSRIVIENRRSFIFDDSPAENSEGDVIFVPEASGSRKPKSSRRRSSVKSAARDESGLFEPAEDLERDGEGVRRSTRLRRVKRR